MADSHGARTGPEASSSVNWMVRVISSLESSSEARCWGQSRLAEMIAGTSSGDGLWLWSYGSADD